MKKAVHEGLLFSCCQKAAQKHGWYPIYNLPSKDFLFRLTVISAVAERRNLISPWYQPHYGGRFPGSEPQKNKKHDHS